MSLIFQIILVLTSIIFMIFVLKKIRDSKMRIEDAVSWILFSFILIILSVFPGIAEIFSKWIGVISTQNFIFLAIIFILLIKAFNLTLKVSVLTEKINALSQSIAIREHTTTIHNATAHSDSIDPPTT